ncbi:MAG: peptide ABC transporter substrate-binding protein [Candidatus Latescibacteria bacterium]|nr:peptide ABC transporter substrate-binding protein [Candidatus Latescibacterota bacterium]
MRRMMTVVVGVFVCALTVSAVSPRVNRLGKPLPPDAAAPERQVLRIMYTGPEPRTLDATLDNYGAGRGEYLFERLTLLDESENLIPGAAERWEASRDGKTWTFHLRRGARWSDGHPVTAHDFEWTYKTLLEPSIGNVYAFLFYEIKGARDFNLGKLKDRNAIGVKALNDLTFVIQTEKPCPYLPYLTSYLSAAPIPRWQFEKYGKKWATPGRCASNASYKLVEWTPQQQMVFALDPNYNGPYKGTLEKVTIKFGATGTGLLPYENNEIDLLHDISPLDLPHITSDPKLKHELVTWPHTQTWYLFFRTQKPPFNVLKVRQAIGHAINRDILCTVVRKGLAIPAYTMLPPGFPGYVGDKYKSIQAYDPPLARRLLAEAGYPGGRGFPRVAFWLNGNDAALRGIGQAIQGMLKEHLGITVDLQPQETTVYMTNLYQHTIPVGLGAFQSDYPDPHNLLAMVWHSQPSGHGRHDWTNPAFDRLVDTADFEMNPAKRMQLYDEAEKTLATDAGGVFLYQTVLAQIRKPWVKGFVKNKQGYSPFWWNHMTHVRLYRAQ